MNKTLLSIIVSLILLFINTQVYAASETHDVSYGFNSELVAYQDETLQNFKSTNFEMADTLFEFNANKNIAEQMFLKSKKSLFLIGTDIIWGSADFWTIGGILEIGLPNIFDGFGAQFGFGFGVWDKGSEGDYVCFDILLGIKYTLNAGKFFYPSVGLRLFGVSTFSILRVNDSNSGLEVYFDVRVPFAEILMVVLHFGPQIPLDAESETIFTAGLSLALHF